MHAILFQFKSDTIVSNLVKSFRYIKENTSTLNRNQKICKFHKLDKNWLIHESLGLNPD